MQTSARLLGLALVLGFAAGYGTHARLTRPDPGATAALDTTRNDVARIDSTAAARTAADRTARRQLAAADTLLRTTLSTAARDSQLADSLRQVLDTTQLAADSLRRLAQALDAARQRETDSLRAALVIVTGQRDLATARWVAADSAAAEAQRALHDALRRLEAATAQTRARPAWRRILHDGSCAGAGYFAAREQLGGAAAGGLLCVMTGG